MNVSQTPDDLATRELSAGDYFRACLSAGLIAAAHRRRVAVDGAQLVVRLFQRDTVGLGRQFVAQFATSVRSLLT